MAQKTTLQHSMNDFVKARATKINSLLFILSMNDFVKARATKINNLLFILMSRILNEGKDTGVVRFHQLHTLVQIQFFETVKIDYLERY